MSLKGGLLNYLVKPNLSHFSFIFIYEEPCNKFKCTLTILDPTISKLPSEGKKKVHFQDYYSWEALYSSRRYNFPYHVNLIDISSIWNSVEETLFLACQVIEWYNSHDPLSLRRSACGSGKGNVFFFFFKEMYLEDILWLVKWNVWGA